MKKRHLYLLLAACVVSFSSCADDSSPSAAADPQASAVETASNVAGSIQPRSPGSKWTYASTFIIDGKKESGGITIEEVIRTTTIDGTECYLVQLTMDYRSLVERMFGAKLTEDDYDYFWEYYNEKGSYNYWPDSKNDTPSSLDDFALTLPYPTEKGHSYRVDDAETWTVLSTDTKVKTSLGEYTCVVYQVEYDVEEGETYISRERFFQSPGVGLVKWEMDVKENDKWIPDSIDILYKLDLK